MATRIAAFTVILMDNADIRPNHEIRVVTLTTEQGLPDDWQKTILDRHPNEKDIFPLLELIFKYGQNDFQPSCVRSVSVGDIIVLNATGQGANKV